MPRLLLVRMAVTRLVKFMLAFTLADSFQELDSWLCGGSRSLLSGPLRSGDVREKKRPGGFAAGSKENHERPGWLASIRADVLRGGWQPLL